MHHSIPVPRCLLMVHNGAMHAALAVILGRMGHVEVLAASRCEDTLGPLCDDAVDLLILECDETSQVCADLIRRIRHGRAGCRHFIPIIVLIDPKVGDSLETSQCGQVMLAGASVCVVKPVSDGQFTTAVHRTLDCVADRIGRPSVDWSMQSMEAKLL